MNANHFSNTEAHPTPMMSAELLYWLTQGRKIFRHRGQYFMCLRPPGRRVLVQVSEGQLEKVSHLTKLRGMILGLSDEMEKRLSNEERRFKGEKILS